MSSVIEYKGYTGSVEFSESDMLFYGKVLGIRSLIMYEGKDVDSLLNDFHESVDLYLESCKADKREPEVPYKGNLNIRLSPEIHHNAALRAMAFRQSLNSFIQDAVKEKLARA
ncbi:MAG: type II toxin-antitoxin system HicB family antitoxin [Eubacterium sp.]|nr:type II toxin-antitoxin system HicB family antitoxin [Eubacterium sp.]